MTDKIETFLIHHGVLGMHWGIRKKKETLNRKKSGLTPGQKKALFGAGVGVLAIGAVAATVILKKRGGIKAAKSAFSLADDGKVFAKKLIDEPTDIIHAARGKDVGFRMAKKGGLNDALHEYEKAFGHDSAGTAFFQRYGDNLEKVAVRFRDPQGRLDRAGRPIFHEVIAPKHLSDDINDIEQAQAKLWPLIKDDYDKLYKLEPGS